MSTIGGLSTSTSSSIRGYGGLASGLDRDTLIEGMTSGTTSKITQQQQKKQQLEWKQEAVRSITDMMLAFANKYTSSWSSKTNLFSSVFWGRNKLSVMGENSKYVSVSGTATSADGVSIMGVKQLAEKAKWSSKAGVSDQTLSTSEVDITKTYDVQQLIGKELNFKLGDGSSATTYSLTLKESEKIDGKVVTYDYSTPEKAMEAINDQLERIAVSINGKSEKLSKYVQIGLQKNQDNDQYFTITGSGEGNNFELTGGSALKYLGFAEDLKHNFVGEGDDKDKNKTITASSKAKDNLIDHVNLARLLNGKTLTFSYNGKTAEISMPSEAELKNLMDNVTESSDIATKKKATEDVLDKIVTSVQDQLDAVFGKGRIKVDKTAVQTTTEDGKDILTGGQITFKTMNPKDGQPDTTSILKIVSGSSDVKWALGLRDGMSNRVNMNEQLKNRLPDGTWKEWEDVKDEKGNVVKDADGKVVQRGKASIQINGHNIDVYSDDTMDSLMARINSTKEAGVKVSYQEAADKFTFTATDDGASGSIKILKDDITEKLFGITSDIQKTGQDAIVAVKYAGSDDEVELIRGSNSFTIDGLTINVKGEFGYVEKKDDDGNVVMENGKAVMELDKTTEAVEIDAQVDADSIVDAVKAMVDEYNTMIESINKQLTTKPDRDYAPLTSEQKKELSDDEIEAWEKKAKEGLLYADSDIRSLSSDLRFIIGGGIAQELSEMGISTSSTYSDNGKLTFDETKFRAALASNPERVQQLFAESSVTNTNGKGTSTGIATALKNVMDKYVNTMGSMESKGILIRKAGSESAPMSITENTMYKQLQEINDMITKLQERLETERDRYIKQFTSLETLISQMNSQSSFLSQLGGY